MSKSFRIAIVLWAVCGASVLAGICTGQDAQQGTKNDSPQIQTSTIKADSRLVILDVIVTDGHGKAVPGLTLGDFIVRENGAVQRLKSLDDHTGPAAALAVVDAALPKGTYSNRPRVVSSVWNVLVLDLLNSGREDQARTRAEVLKFSKKLSARVPVALVVLSASSARVLVPFTLSGAAIEEALLGKDASPVASPLLDVFNADDVAMKEKVMVGGPMLARSQDNAQRVEMDRMDMRVDQTLRSLSGIAGWLAQYPGKKNLYWLSSGFPLTVQPTEGRSVDRPGATDNYRRSYIGLQREADKQLESARVAVFPVDVRGNSGAAREGIDTADIRGSRYAKPDGATQLNDDLNQFDSRVNESQAGMLEMADATGGVATMNRNGIAEILSDEFQQAEHFYTLSYPPQNGNWNGDYRRINVELAKRGYRLYYRHGYYALDPPGPVDSAARKLEPTSIDAFTIAMRHGARPASEVLFTSRVDRIADAQIRIGASVDMRTLSLGNGSDAAGDGRKVASVDCAVVEYDEGGKVLGTSQVHVEGRLHTTALQPTQSLPVELKVPLATGAKWAAIGVRDSATGKFGTLEVPLDGQ